jgi:hypothetical protein
MAVHAHPLEFTIGTSPQGVSGPLVPARVEDTPGCSAADYDGVPVAGAAGHAGRKRTNCQDHGTYRIGRSSSRAAHLTPLGITSGG